MRIGIDIRTLMDRRYSGIPEYSFCVLNEILKQDRENEYILFYNSFKDISDRIGNFEQENVKIAKTGYPSKVFNYILQKALKKPKLDRLLDVDVFFMPHFNFATFSGQAKSIITVHDVSFLIYPEFFSQRKNLWHKAIGAKDFLHNFDRIVAISDNTKQDLIELCGIDPTKISTVYSGISEDFKIMPKDSEMLSEVKKKYHLPDRFILYLGTIEPRKNVDGLIRAFEKLLQDKTGLEDVYLVIAGAKGWKYENVIDLYEKSIFKDKIILTGYVDKSDKAALYNLAEIFAYPSFYEGFGFPPLEAMACGTPSIVGANSSMTEVLGDAALFIDPYDINSIKNGITALLGGCVLRERWIKKGLGVAKEYTWKKTADEMIGMIKKLKEDIRQ